MAQDVCVIVDAEDRARLAAVIGDRNRPHKQAWHHSGASRWGWLFAVIRGRACCRLCVRICRSEAGGCFCGAIRYRVDGPPRRVTHCHCVHCRRTSGAPFVTWAEFDPAKFTIVKGQPRECECRPLVTRWFCGDCGTQLTYQRAKEPDTIDLTVASFDAPEEVTPQDHIWCDRMLPWIRLADDLPRYKQSQQ